MNCLCESTPLAFSLGFNERVAALRHPEMFSNETITPFLRWRDLHSVPRTVILIASDPN